MRVHCEGSGPVPPSGWTVLRITSINDESDTVTWPLRLHPAEGTVSFVVDGVRHRGAEQIDSIVDTVELVPGHAISTGVLVASGDLGPILPDVGEVALRVAVQPPGLGDEVLSNEVHIEVLDDDRDVDDIDGDQHEVLVRATARDRRLRDVDTAATAVRDGEALDIDLGAALAEVPVADRPWVVTALLPAAPYPDDELLAAARELDDVDQEEDSADDPLASFVLDGRPYDASEWPVS